MENSWDFQCPSLDTSVECRERANNSFKSGGYNWKRVVESKEVAAEGSDLRLSHC